MSAQPDNVLVNERVRRNTPNQQLAQGGMFGRPEQGKVARVVQHHDNIITTINYCSRGHDFLSLESDDTCARKPHTMESIQD